MENATITNIVNNFTEAMQMQEYKNYLCTVNGLSNGNITFEFDKNENETLIKFEPYNVELVLEFENYKFIRDINPSLLWYCYNKQPLPISEIKALTTEEQAQLIVKCIEECDCMCSYEYYSEILEQCS